MKIHLIHPPLWSIDAPPGGISTLNAYLRRQRVPVRCFDLNIEFHRYILSSKFLQSCFREMKTYIKFCNNKKMTCAESEKFRECVDIMPAMQFFFRNGNYIRPLSKNKYKKISYKDYRKKRDLIIFGLKTVSACYHPLSFIPGANNFGFISSFKQIEELIQSDRMEIFKNFFVNRCERHIPRAGRHIIGFSCADAVQLTISLEWSKRIKKINPALHIVIGGFYLSHMKENFKNFAPIFSYVDSIIVDEGMKPLKDLYLCMENKKSKAGVSNLIWKPRDNKKVRFNGLTYLADIRDYPAPDFTGMPVMRYPFYPQLPLPASRGCYSRCTFCEYPRRRAAPWKQDTPDIIADKMIYLKKKYGIPLIYFAVNTLPLKTLLKVSCELIRRKEKLFWTLQTRSDRRLTPEEGRILYNAGCLFIAFGIESANPRIVKLMNKKINIEAVQTNIRSLRRAGIHTGLNFIFNFPTETHEEFCDSLDFILRNKKFISAFQFSPFVLIPFSRIWKCPSEYKVRYKRSDKDDPITAVRRLDTGIPIKVILKKMEHLNKWIQNLENEFETSKTYFRGGTRYLGQVTASRRTFTDIPSLFLLRASSRGNW